MDGDDPIRKLLQQTGWSYGEILKKLEAYKDQFPSDEEKKENGEEKKQTNQENANQNDTNGGNIKANSSEETSTNSTNDESVELQLQCNTERSNVNGISDKETFINSNTDKCKNPEVKKGEGHEIKLKISEEKNEPQQKERKENNKHNKELTIDKQECIQLNDSVKESSQLRQKEKTSIPKSNVEEKSETVEEEKTETELENPQNETKPVEEKLEKSVESENSVKEKSEKTEEKIELDNREKQLQEDTKLSLELEAGEEEENLKVKSKSDDSDEEDLEIIIERLEKSLEQVVESENSEEAKLEVTLIKKSISQNHKKPKVTEDRNKSEVKKHLVNISKDDLEFNEKNDDIEIVKILQSSAEYQTETENVNENLQRISIETSESTNDDKQVSGNGLSLIKIPEGEFKLESNNAEIVIKVGTDLRIEKLSNHVVELNKELEANKTEKLSAAVKEDYLEGNEERSNLEKIAAGLEKVKDQKGIVKPNEEKSITEDESKKTNKEPTNSNITLQNFQDSTQKFADKNAQEGKPAQVVINQDLNTKASQQLLEDILIEVSVKDSCGKQTGAIRSKRMAVKSLRGDRLRVLRKYRNIHYRKIKKRGEVKSKAVATEDIRYKLKEQLQLLRTRRKSVDSHLVQSKSRGILKFPPRNRNRLNRITNTLISKLSSANKMICESDRGDLELIDCDAVNSEYIMPNKVNSDTLNDLQYSAVTDKGRKEEIFDRQPGKSEEVPVVLTNETNLMIVNVVGGYKSPTPEEALIDVETNKTTITTDKAKVNNLSLNDASVLSSELLNGIKPTKTTDVTKIKGWKNKIFAIAKRDGQRKPSEKLLYQLLYDSESSSQSGPVGLDNEPAAKKSDSSSLISEKPENTPNQSKSAFISEELDQFLTKNSELNISYEVPKLEAEQTITTKYIDIKFPKLPQENIQPALARNRESYKPKTLAEKRKMLAEAEKPEIKDFMFHMTSKQRKNYEQSVLSMRKKLIEEEVPFTRRCFVASTSITNTHNFVVYNGKRLKVPSSSDQEVVGEIKEKKKCKTTRSSPQQKNTETKISRKRKISLLSELKTDTKTIYDPNYWETVQKKLPRVLLEIKPRVGKPINPRIEHLIKSDDVILARNRVEFALTALNVKNVTPNQKTFVFPLRYKDDQTHVRLRKKLTDIADDPKITTKPSETDTEIAKTVEDVVSKMLDYIEISETTNDIMKDESDPENDCKLDLPKQTDSSSDKNCRKRKRKIVYGEKGVHRTTLEMKRLNCKIVSISLDEENGENQPCPKEFCKLGCVCKSIECSSKNLLPSHCGLPRCMFECKCRYKNMDVGEKISLPAGTDIFSEGIINRLQNEAKRNLAKVEKEFTQTVIKTNNQIIMVGDSKARRRRATKMPKKYFDYVEEDPSENRSPSKYISAESKYRSLAERAVVEPCEEDVNIKSCGEKTVIIKPCSVKLLKWDFSKIMPFCMVHSLYKCHCKNRAVSDSSVGDKNVVACTYVTPPQAAPTRNRLKPRLDRNFDKEKFSSRTRGLPTSYYLIRNKSLSHKNKIRKNSNKLQKELEVYLRLNATQILHQNSEETPAEVCKTLTEPEPPKETKRRRKQSLIVLEDHGSDTTNSFELTTNKQHNDAERELKLQRRKLKPVTKLTGQEVVNSIRTNEESLASSLFGNTQKLKCEFLAALGRKNSQLRLIPWSTVATRYKNGTFQLWYSNTSKACPLIITENGKRPTTHHYNITLFEQMPHESSIPSDIIRWLITKKVPLEKSSDNIFLALSQNKSYWEICGLCEKKADSAKAKDQVSLSVIDSWNSPENNSETSAAAEPTIIDLDSEDKNENSAEQNQVSQEATQEVVHENLQESKKVMYCSKRRFQPKKLISDETHDDNSLKIRQVLWACIPSVTLACKWRVIYMNLGFAYLSLSRSSYTIKHDDIVKALKIAHSDQTTIVLKSDELQKNYPHRNFGIYCVPNYFDKIFVGPYFLNENHDLDTLSFVNSVLVNTSLFNQIKGKNVPGTGRWFHQATTADDKNIDDDVMIVQEPLPVVDLTCESDEESSDTSKKRSACLQDSEFKNQSTLLKSMLLSPLSKAATESEEENTKAERALDTLLKKGQINVNKTLVQLDSLNNLNQINSPPLQTLPKTNDSQIKNLALSESQSTSDCSDWNDEDRLIIDEELDENIKQVTDKNNDNPDSVNRYLLTNISGLGYISAYQHENSKTVDVICPITKKKKRFSTPKAAIAALERVFVNKFFRAPTNFKIEFRMLEKLENVAEAPLDRTVLQGFHIVGSFGVKNLLHCTATELENFGLNKVQITEIWKLFEKKLLWSPICQLAKLLAIPVRETELERSLSDILDESLKEIKTLVKDSSLFIREKIDLESKKVMLAEKCAKLLYHLPSDERSKAQQELDRIFNFSNRQLVNNSISSGEITDTSKAKLVNVSEPIEVPDNDDDLLRNPKESPKKKTMSITTPTKFTLTKGKGSLGTSLLSGKKVEVPNQRSLLLDKKQDTSPNKYVLVSRTRNSSGTLVSTPNTVDLSKCTFQIKSSKAEEKLLVKELPIKVRKELLEVANNRQPKQKLGKVLKPFSATTTINMTKPVLSSIPTMSSISRSNVSAIQPTFTSVNVPKFTSSQVSSSKNVNVVPSIGVPLCVPMTVVPSSPKSIGGLRKPSTMATLTPVSKPSFVLKSGTAKSAPNLIAIKEGNSYKYFQIVAEDRTSLLQPVQAIKRPASSVRVQPPLKKIAPATSLLTNQKTDK